MTPRQSARVALLHLLAVLLGAVLLSLGGCTGEAAVEYSAAALLSVVAFAILIGCLVVLADEGRPRK